MNTSQQWFTSLHTGVLAFAVASTTAFASTDTSSTATDVSELLRSNKHQEFTLAPNGQRVAHIEREQGNHKIVITHTNGQRSVLNSKDLAVSQLHWISNQRIAFSTEGQVRAVNVDGSSYQILVDNLHYKEDNKSVRFARLNSRYRHWEVSNPMHNDPDHILLRAKDADNNAYVHRYSLINGDLTLLADGDKTNVKEWIVAANGRVGFGVKEGKQAEFLASADTAWDNFEQHAEALDIDFKAGSFIERRSVFMGLGNETNIAYFAENNTGDRFKVVEYDLNEDVATRVLAEDPRYDVGGDKHTELAYDRFNGNLVGIHYQADKPKTIWLDKSLAAYQRHIESRYPAEVHRIKQWSDNRRHLLIESFDDAARKTLYAVDTSSFNRLKIAHLDTGAQNLAAKQAIQFKTRDGYVLDGYLTVPHVMSESVPLVVMPHGGPWSRDIWRYSEEAQFFAQQGFATLNVNFRGSTGQGLQHIQAGIGELAGLMIDDIADASQWAIQQGIANPDHIFVMGTSYGGYAALMSAHRYPELYKAVSSNAAPLDLIAQFKHYKRNDYDFAYNYWSEAVANPKTQKDLLKEMSPITHLDDLELPVKVFHGSLDGTVPVSNAKAAQKFIEKRHVHIISNEGHGFNQEHNRLFFLKQSLQLFQNA